MPKPISEALHKALTGAPPITRKIDVRYDAPACVTRAVVTYSTPDGEQFSHELTLCAGPILDVKDVWIGGVHIPPEDITFSR